MYHLVVCYFKPPHLLLEIILQLLTNCHMNMIHAANEAIIQSLHTQKQSSFYYFIIH